jgi:hypothetical protein
MHFLILFPFSSYVNVVVKDKKNEWKWLTTDKHDQANLSLFQKLPIFALPGPFVLIEIGSGQIKWTRKTHIIWQGSLCWTRKLWHENSPSHLVHISSIPFRVIVYCHTLNKITFYINRWCRLYRKIASISAYDNLEFSPFFQNQEQSWWLLLQCKVRCIIQRIDWHLG